MSASTGPLLTQDVHGALVAAADAGEAVVECSLDLCRSRTTVQVTATGWAWAGRHFPFLKTCRERTVYHWTGAAFEPVARFNGGLIKLVPTAWGPPTFEIDGIKMLPTARISPWEDAGRKVGLIRPRGKVILDTCGGLGYFAARCLEGQAAHVHSWEKNADVLWLRSLNPWSPGPSAGLTLAQGDIVERVAQLAGESVDAVLHDPPRFGIAGELYSQAFYDQLARVLRRRGSLYHYTGAPNRLTTGRDVPKEVTARLRRAGFATEPAVDGVLAVKLSTGRGSA